MTTIINTPPRTNDDSSTALVVGIILAILVIVLFIVFGLPYLRGMTYSPAPAPASSVGATVNVITPNTPTVTNTATQ